MNKKSVVIVGGGTGTHTVLRGLKQYTDKIDITAIVSMADSGGSTGRLRDEFGQLPAGDVRNALTALASNNNTHDTLLRELFMYRFAKGEGLSGHNFGNLFLTVLTDILGSEVAAIEAASRILRVAGKVVPVTTDSSHLVATYADGTVVVGEHDIDELYGEALRNVKITKLDLAPKANLNPNAAQIIKDADMVVLGPGDLYTSILANCVVDGFKEALQASSAKIVYVCNLMSKPGQTVGMQAAEHLAEVAHYAGVTPQHLLINDQPLPADLLEKYAAEETYPIINNFVANQTTSVHACPLLAEEIVETKKGDVLRRSLIRHDSNRLAKALMSFVE